MIVDGYLYNILVQYCVAFTKYLSIYAGGKHVYIFIRTEEN